MSYIENRMRRKELEVRRAEIRRVVSDCALTKEELGDLVLESDQPLRSIYATMYKIMSDLDETKTEVLYLG